MVINVFNISWPKRNEDLSLEMDAIKKADPNMSHDIDLHSLPTLYNNLVEVLVDMGIPYEKVFGQRFRVPDTFKENKDIYLSYHSSSNELYKNLWHIHTSPLPGYFSFDRRGFSCFSEPAINSNFFELSKLVDIDLAREWYNTFSTNYINSNISRIQQPDQDAYNIPNDRPHIFIGGQLSFDSVLRSAHFDVQQYYNNISNMFPDHNIFYKGHPGSQPGKPNTLIAPQGSNVIQYTGSIHSIIKNADAVCVVNSGVGFESLLHLKHVFTAGRCDYQWVTHNLKSISDMNDMPNLIARKVDEDKVIKFLYYMANEVYVAVDDKQRIATAIEKAIKINNG